MESLFTDSNICKKLTTTIHGIFMNQNNTLLSVATNNGYKIYESYNYLQVSEEDEFQDLIGPLKIAIPFYESSLVIFVGNDDNNVFPSNQIIVWDDLRSKKIGFIMLREKILDLQVTKEVIYVMIPDKIILFSMLTFEYVYTITDVNHIKCPKLYISLGVNPAILIHVPNSRPNQLKLTKCKYNNLILVLMNSKYQVRGKIHMVFTTPFKTIYKLNMSKKVKSYY